MIGIIIYLIINQIFLLMNNFEYLKFIGLLILIFFLIGFYFFIPWFFPKLLIITPSTIKFYVRKFFFPWKYDFIKYSLIKIKYFYTKDNGIILVEKEVYKFYQIPLGSNIENINKIKPRVCNALEHLGKEKILDVTHLEWIESLKKESSEMKKIVNHHIALNEFNRP
jgi:hypothetical protein